MNTLFYAPGTVGLASLIALKEAGIAHDVHFVDFKTTAQRSPEYLAVNPKGRVPALKTDQGILTETPAILVYIAQIAPQAKLAPLDDPFAFAAMQSFNAYLCSTVHVAHAHRGRGARWADEESSYEDMRRRVPGNVAACYDLIENEFFKGPWVMGENYSVADAYLFTVDTWLEADGVDIKRFPKVYDHFQRMQERPAVKAALAAAPA